jgi:hypothetical protein
MNINELLRFFLLPIYQPIQSIQLLLENKRKITYSVLIFLFLGIIYTISVQLAYMKGLGANVEPFIKIPANEYYFWQRFYQIPFFFITSIIFAGTVRLLSIVFSGKGNFEDHFCIFAIAQTLPMFITMWIPETIYIVFFSKATVMPIGFDVSRQVIGILWPLIIMIIGISFIENIKWYHSLIVTLIASVPTVLLMVIFIR